MKLYLFIITYIIAVVGNYFYARAAIIEEIEKGTCDCQFGIHITIMLIPGINIVFFIIYTFVSLFELFQNLNFIKAFFFIKDTKEKVEIDPYDITK